MDRSGVVSDGWIQNLLAAAAFDPADPVLVLVDDPNREVGDELATAVREAGGDAELAYWSGADRPWPAAPAPLIDAAGRATLCFYIAAQPLGEEARARFEFGEAITGRGGREIFMGFTDPELLRGELSQPQPDLQAVADRLLAQLDGAREVHVRGAAGTDLRLRVEGRPWITDVKPLGPGMFANFPGGEVFVAPHADGADGVLVADLTVPYTVEGLVDAPVTLRFERGRISSIEGGRAADLLRALVEGAGAGADTIAELGIGFNPTVTPRGHVMLDEKAGKTAHVAIGRNTGPYGGDNDAKIHVDCVFSLPQFDVDGRPLELPA
jgi:2,5-dihydroxypyridine 5,6-dioxygenase